jgi:hypothetical protein
MEKLKYSIYSNAVVEGYVHALANALIICRRCRMRSAVTRDEMSKSVQMKFSLKSTNINDESHFLHVVVALPLHEGYDLDKSTCTTQLYNPSRFPTQHYLLSATSRVSPHSLYLAVIDVSHRALQPYISPPTLLPPVLSSQR